MPDTRKLFVARLLQKKKITHSKALDALESLHQGGWFDPNLIEKAKDDIRP